MIRDWKYAQNQEYLVSAIRMVDDKERIKKWFMKNVILPNNEIIDKPGFIVYQFNAKAKQAYMREMLFPETILANIEKETAKKYKEKGRRALYRAGKRWGYRFAQGSLFPLRKKTS